MNLLADMVEQKMGLAAWNDVLQQAGLDGAYTAGGIYEDAELFSIVSIISHKSGIPEVDLVFAFGEFMFPAFKERYPELIDDDLPLLDFLATIDDVIHVEVKKLYPDAIPPAFDYLRHRDDQLELRYTSDRKLCRLAEGLIAGAAAHFKTDYDLEHHPCMHDGADYCGIHVTTR